MQQPTGAQQQRADMPQNQAGPRDEEQTANQDTIDEPEAEAESASRGMDDVAADQCQPVGYDSWGNAVLQGKFPWHDI